MYEAALLGQPEVGCNAQAQGRAVIVLDASIWNEGDHDRAQHLGAVLAANVSGFADEARYAVVAVNQDGTSDRAGLVRHRRSRGWWGLLERIMEGNWDDVPDRHRDVVATWSIPGARAVPISRSPR